MLGHALASRPAACAGVRNAFAGPRLCVLIVLQSSALERTRDADELASAEPGGPGAAWTGPALRKFLKQRFGHAEVIAASSRQPYTCQAVPGSTRLVRAASGVV